MSNASNRLMSELSSLKSKYHTELIDLNSSVDTTSQQASELQKLCKRQARQIEVSDKLITLYISLKRILNSTYYSNDLNHK